MSDITPGPLDAPTDAHDLATRVDEALTNPRNPLDSSTQQLIHDLWMLAGWPSGQARGIGAAGDDRPVLFRGPAAGAADWFWRGECAWTTPVVVLDDSEHTAGETDGIEGDRLAARLDGGRPVVPPAPRVGPAEPAPTKEDGTDG